MQKTDPIRVPDSGPKIGAVFRPLVVIIISWRIAVPILGPESGPKMVPLLDTRVAKKCDLGFPEMGTTAVENGHCQAVVRLAIPPHAPTDWDHLFGSNLATASPHPSSTICSQQGQFCVTYFASNRPIPFAEVVACNDAALASRCCRHRNSR